ncbi:hypothetical protein [Sporolactobacillus vineae]|uniref:hypothetical protein n=1 Tax=Sporolactobacillus vineae TaxID=444463 RepID=UPI000288C696|nr:hypothetical protein [Sporolactobacillus vineae]
MVEKYPFGQVYDMRKFFYFIGTVLLIMMVSFIIYGTLSSAGKEHFYTSEHQAVHELIKNKPYIKGVLSGTDYSDSGERAIPYYFQRKGAKYGFGVIIVEKRNNKYAAMKGSDEISTIALKCGTNGTITLQSPHKQKYYFEFDYKHYNYRIKTQSSNWNFAQGFVPGTQIYYFIQQK